MSRQKPLPLASVRITDPFWSERQKVLVDAALLHQHEQLESTGRLENFRKVIRGESGNHEGRFFFNDSDVTKWIEACAYALTVRPNDPKSPELRKKMDEAIDLIVKAQDSDGYVNTFFQLNAPTMRFRNLHIMHELYCGGHMLEAGVAVFEGLGDRRLLDVSIRFADLVDATFGPGKRIGYCGHEEFEYALVRLSDATGQKKYRDLARWMVEIRGTRPSPFEAEFKDEEAMNLYWKDSHRAWIKDGEYSGEYGQDHAPIREHQTVVGHAVRAMYLYMAAADLCEDDPLKDALVGTWQNLIEKRLYITGGLGPSAHNEGFTTDYDLPNLSAYAETCAAVGLVFWGSRLLELTGDSEYADVMERALYNGAISGISLDGKGYFYTNPLESRGGHERKPWFECACCPPNIARLIGSVSKYVVGASPEAFSVFMPVGFETTAVLGGVKTKISLEGNYPWTGKFRLSINPEKAAKFALRLRLPDWSDEISIELMGADEEADYDQGFAVFDRTWKPGDVLEVEFEMPVRWIESNSDVLDNLGRVALTRGPLVYAFESPDGGVPQKFSADLDGEVEQLTGPSVLGKPVALKVMGMSEVVGDFPGLYAEVGNTKYEETTATAIPYFTWANRGPSAMQVWVRSL